MKYTPAQIAKFLTAVVTGLSTIGVSFAQALKEGGITPDEWAVLIPIISGVIITAIGVYAVPNGLQGDQPTNKVV
jgi:hypothetical protein